MLKNQTKNHDIIIAESRNKFSLQKLIMTAQNKKKINLKTKKTLNMSALSPDKS